MVAFLLRLVLGLGFLALLPGVAGALWVVLTTAGGFGWWPIIAGLAAGTALYFILLRRIPGFEVFEHELTHALVAWLYFRRVTNFSVKRDNGHVIFLNGFGGVFGNDMIGFAPYVLPTFTAILVLIRPFLHGPLWWYDFWIGVSFGYHLFSGYRELSPRQPDLASRGLLYSFIAVPALALTVHGLLLAILIHGYAGVPSWAAQVWATTLRAVTFLAGQR
ncbi:MAG: hypothetical protein BWY76_01383 [bacterium ADurb.Bin429]|nr:MAG: hypothetical protein BWY76_01383 [bacterium ADurb.Bin429]